MLIFLQQEVLLQEPDYTFKFIEEAKENFNLYGVLDDQQTEVFIPNKDYKGFVIQRKKL